MRPANLIVAAIAALALAMPAVAQDVSERQITWLFVLQGVVAAVDGDQLTIAETPEALAFTDAPERRTRPIDLDTLAALWAENGAFNQNPPNAALIDETEETIGVIEITNLVHDDNTIVMTFTTIEGGPPAVGDHVAVTIDDWTCWLFYSC